ncbi:MAG: DUF1573 domain-containing protein [Polaribacter sp.]|nr:DUF1573 domain-containing protein [Polaribacter sp.]
MRKQTLSLVFTITISFFIGCKDATNVSKKINKENLDKAKTRDVEIKKGTAMISFDKKEYDFGIVNEGTVVETSYLVTNSGKTDLVITNAKASCGCTVPVWPRDAIKPGKTGEVKVKFNTSGKPNRQQKTITLTTNTESGREVLVLKGSVTPKAKK